MHHLFTIPIELSWSIIIVFTWFSSELISKRIKFLPKVNIYIIVGFILANWHILPMVNSQNINMLTDIAIGLILFECGYLINLNWFRTNPWFGITALIEAGIIFIVVYIAAHYVLNLSAVSSIIIAMVTMSSSPEISLKAVNQVKSLGQVSDRSIYLATTNFALTAIAITILPIILNQRGDILWQIVWDCLVNLGISIILGIISAIFVSKFIRIFGNTTESTTITYSLAVVLIITLSQSMHVSFILATLIFGLISRYLKVDIGTIQKNFGTLGEVLTIFPFLIFGSMLPWSDLITGLGVALIFILIRALAKLSCIAVLSRVSGVSWPKGILTGLSLMPVSTFIIFLFPLHTAMGSYTHAVITALWFINIFSLLITQNAFVRAKETPHN